MNIYLKDKEIYQVITETWDKLCEAKGCSPKGKESDSEGETCYETSEMVKGKGGYSICPDVPYVDLEGRMYNRAISKASANHAVKTVIKEMKNPFVGYVNVTENIRMAKEQGFERFRGYLKKLIEEMDKTNS